MSHRTDTPFEAHLGALYHQRIDGVAVPSSLRYAVLAIPDAEPRTRDLLGSRRLLIVLVAGLLMALALSGAVAIGSGLIRLPWVPDVPDANSAATSIFRDLGLTSVTVSSSQLATAGGTGVEIGVVPQPDGTILVTRISGLNLVLTRLDEHGSIDETFGSGGKMRVRHGWNPIVRALADYADGSVVVLSEEGAGEFVITKYRADGEVDAAFGEAGAVRFTQAAEGTAIGVAVQTDGKVVVAGSSGMGPPQVGMVGSSPDRVRFVLRRFNADGTTDSSFGGGDVSHGLSLGQDPVGGLLIQTDGRILVVGSTGLMTPGGEDNDIALVRWMPDGTLDDSFGGDGSIELHLPGSIGNLGRGVAQLADGRLIVLGEIPGSLVLARISPDGRLDSSFGNAGFVTPPSITGGPGFLATQPDGKILIGTTSRVLRFNLDGSLDTAFGDRGGTYLP